MRDREKVFTVPVAATSGQQGERFWSLLFLGFGVWSVQRRPWLQFPQPSKRSSRTFGTKPTVSWSWWFAQQGFRTFQEQVDLGVQGFRIWDAENENYALNRKRGTLMNQVTAIGAVSGLQ